MKDRFLDYDFLYLSGFNYVIKFSKDPTLHGCDKCSNCEPCTLAINCKKSRVDLLDELFQTCDECHQDCDECKECAYCAYNPEGSIFLTNANLTP